MSVDRFGKPLALAWSQTEIIWLEAAITLATKDERMAAYRDIAGMTGRTVAAVTARARSMRDDKVAELLRSHMKGRPITPVLVPAASIGRRG